MKPERGQVWMQGLFAGLIGYATVVVFFGVLNAIEGRSPFFTVAALGAALFEGVRDPAQVTVAPGSVFAYNGLHLVLFLVVGQVGSWLVYATERHHSLWYVIFFLVLAGFIYGLTITGVFGAEIAHAVPWWSVVAANVAWVAAVAGYFWWSHPRLLGELREEQGGPAT
jgi:hypothetical protein